MSVRAGRPEQDDDDDRHADQMPPDRDVVEQGHQSDAVGVQQALREEDDGQEADGVPRRQPVGLVGPLRQEGRDRVGAAETDAGRHGDLPQQVEPAGEPRPDRGAVAGRALGRPVVQAAGRRVGRADLAHREADEDHDHADEQPAPVHDRRAAVEQAELVDGQAARQDRDDREGDGEVAEAAHAAVELLGVAELVESLSVSVHRRPRTRRRWRRATSAHFSGWCVHVVSHGCPRSPKWHNRVGDI